MTHDTTEGVAESIAIWEERAAERILGEAVYEKRLKLYAEIYEHDNAFWLHRHGRIGISGATARNPALLQKAIPGDDPVLDIGGGTGVAGDAFSPTREYVICDASSVANAQSSSGLANRRTVIGNATELPFPDATFGAVLILDVLEHLHREDIERSMTQVWRVLRPGGRLLIATPNRISGPWDVRRTLPDPDNHRGLHLNEMSVGDMLRLVRRHGFRALAFQTSQATAMLFDMPPLALWAGLWEGIAKPAPLRYRSRMCPLAVVLASKADG